MFSRFKHLLLIGLLSLSLAFGLVPIQMAQAAGPTPELRQLYQDLDTLYQQAYSASNQGNFDLAEVLWTKAIERMPENPASWSNRGNSRVSQFKLTEAIADFDQAIELAPEESGPYINRGTRMGRPTEVG